MLRSRTNDSSRSTIKFSKQYSAFEIAVIVKGNTGTYPPPPPPPPAGTVKQTIVEGSTIANITGWRAVYDANNDGAEDDPGKIEFYLDDVLVLTEINAPFGDTFATGTPSATRGTAHVPGQGFDGRQHVGRDEQGFRDRWHHTPTASSSASSASWEHLSVAGVP